MRLYTDKVRLIPYESEMWPYIYSWLLSGEYEYFFQNIHPKTSKQIMALETDKNMVFLIVSPLDVKKVIGMASIHQLNDRSRNAHIGCLIDKSYQGKGFGLDATLLLSDYALNQVNLYKLIAPIDPDNLFSIKVVTKIGMVKEAELRYDAYYDGQFHDVHRYYITKSVFNKLHKKSEKENIGPVK